MFDKSIWHYKYKNTSNRETFFLSFEKERWREKEGKWRIFWRNEMRVNVKLRSKKLRTKWSKLFLLWNEQVVKLDENGGRKDDEWLWVSLLNGPRETGSSTVMAFLVGINSLSFKMTCKLHVIKLPFYSLYNDGNLE